MTTQAQALRLAGLSLAVTLSGCFGLDFGAGLPFPTGSMGAGLSMCAAETDLPEGDLQTQVVGTWQDWGGSYKVYTFDANGKVSIASYSDPSTTATGAPAAAPVIEARGQYTVTDSAISIAWDDGKTEVSQLQLDSEPGCVMLNVLPNEHAPTRLEGDRTLGSPATLERVHCEVPPVESNPGLQK